MYNQLPPNVRVMSSVYPDDPPKTYGEWTASTMKGSGRMRTHEYVSMLDRERK